MSEERFRGGQPRYISRGVSVENDRYTKNLYKS